MANPTINWLTKVISVPQSFLTFISGVNYQLDTNAFRNALKDIEDDEAGIPFQKTHNHNGEVLLGGITYARTLEILAPYTITFQETGTPYSVTLIGSNNNILDRTNLGTVQILSNNSAGLIGLTSLVEASESTSRLVEGLRSDHTGYGDVYYWNPITGDDANDGRTPDKAVLTFAQAHTLVTDYGNDIILAMPGGSGPTVTTENLLITKNYVFLRGPGRNFLIQSANDSLDSIKITGAGVEVAKVRIGDTPTNTKHAIWSSGNFVKIDKVYVDNTNKGIEIFGGTRVYVDADIQNNTSYGLKIAGGASRVDVHVHSGDNGGAGVLIDNAGGG